MRLPDNEDKEDETDSGLMSMLNIWAGPLVSWRLERRGRSEVLQAMDQVMERFQKECLQLHAKISSQDTFDEAIAILLVRSVQSSLPLCRQGAYPKIQLC